MNIPLPSLVVSATPQSQRSSIDMGTSSPVSTLVLQRLSIVSGRQLLPHIMRLPSCPFSAIVKTAPWISFGSF
jgi:hypothetical protein